MRDYFASQSFLSKKRRRSGGVNTESDRRGVFLAGGLRRVTNQPLKHGQIVEKAAAANFRKAAARVRPVALVAFGDLDQPGFLEHLQMTAEIAVGESAELLEISESQSLGMCHERGQQPEPGLFVNDTIEAVVGERRI